jgi:hypothetical protein
MKVFWFFFTKKNFFLKKEAKTFFLLDAFDESEACRRLRSGGRHGMKVKPA